MVACLGMPPGDLLHWWNLLFLVPGAVGTMLGLLAMLGVGDHDVDHEHDLGHDVEHDHDLAHDVEHEHEVEHAGHGPGHDVPGADQALHHAVQQGPSHEGWVSTTLSLLGFGRIPFGVSLISLMLFFALFGLGANALLAPLLPYALPLSVVGALAGSAFTTRWVAKLLARIAPKIETHAGTFVGLAGCTGRIVTLLSPTEGYAQLRDRFGNLQEVRCQSARGEALRRDMPILVVEARSADHLVLVVENDLETRVRWARPFGSVTDSPDSDPTLPPESRPPSPQQEGRTLEVPDRPGDQRRAPTAPSSHSGAKPSPLPADPSSRPAPASSWPGLPPSPCQPQPQPCSPDSPAEEPPAKPLKES